MRSRGRSPESPDVLEILLSVCDCRRRADRRDSRLQSGRCAARARLDALERAVERPAAPATPPPMPAHAAPSAATPAAETAFIGHARRHRSRPSPNCKRSATPPPLADAPPPPLPQAQPGFEERIGTRWVVWVGGLTLALGGFFMVRYSIEAGLLGPGVRTILGGLFALALLAAGEWTRRKESISAIAALPIANIPAILTAAGTAVAFATVYAAYALYGFLVPATAFILLGLVALGTLAAALLHGPALAGLGIVGAFVTPDSGLLRQAGLLGALHLSRHRHRGRLWPGARAAVALACGHHDRLRAALDLPGPGTRSRGRAARIPCHRRLHPRRIARGLRLHVRPARRRRPDRADLVRLARGLSVRRDPDRARPASMPTSP